MYNMIFDVILGVMVGDDKKNLTPIHHIWCNFNIKFGVMIGDALRTLPTVTFYGFLNN